jgi:hypothetical protein
LKKSYSEYNKGIYRVTPHVFAVGYLPAVNSRHGFESKPSGGGSLAPVANTRISCKVRTESLSVITMIINLVQITYIQSTSLISRTTGVHLLYDEP